MKGRPVFGFGGVVAETCGCEGAFCPSVVDVAEVPVYRIGGSVSIELVADVDEVLYRSEVDVVYGREVENNGF